MSIPTDRLREIGAMECSILQRINMSLFWSKVRKTDGCWLWQGGKTFDGYGRVHYRIGSRNRNVRAHRVSAMQAGISIPPGMVIDHLCRCRSCVRPDHMRVVTPHENTMAEGSQSVTKRNRDKRECDKCFHPLSWDGRQRRCKPCKHARGRAAYLASLAAEQPKPQQPEVQP